MTDIDTSREAVELLIGNIPGVKPIRNAHEIQEQAVDTLRALLARAEAAEAEAEAIEAAKKVCDEMASDHDDGGGKWADPNWCLTRETAEELSKRIDALHTDATRAALAKKGGE